MSNPLEPVLYPVQGTAGPILYLNPYSGTYTASRSYGLRMQRGYQAGLPQTVARRGTPPPEGLTESQVRRQRFLQRYGFQETVWRRLYRKYIREINSLSSPAGQITPMIVAQVLQNTQNTGLGADWLEDRLATKLADMKDYRERGRSAAPPGGVSQGNVHFFADANARLVTPIELWWYH